MLSPAAALAKRTSGNPAGSPKGALNKLTLAVLAGNRPLTLDKSRHYEAWSDSSFKPACGFGETTLSG